MVLAVDRSKLLPLGSAIDDAQLTELRDAVRLALRFAGTERPLAFDDAARHRWIALYPVLSASQPGLAGAATARAEAHVVRLALIYALLDCSEWICLEHLEAALAVWRYSADSARWIFGDSLGDPTADEIWAAAKERPAGVTRTEVSDMFSRGRSRPPRPGGSSDLSPPFHLDAARGAGPDAASRRGSGRYRAAEA